MRLGPLEIAFHTKAGKEKTVKKKKVRFSNPNPPGWKAVKKAYGFKTFDEAYWFVTVNDLITRLNEIDFLNKLDRKKPEYHI